VLTGATPAPAAAPAAPGMPAVYTDTTPARASSQRDFLTGIAVGAGLVALGVLIGRRR
jgi:hypothetical protein